MKRMTLPSLGVLVFVVLFSTSCALEPGVNNAVRRDHGQVFIYLSAAHKPATDITFSISGITFLNDKGGDIDRTVNRQVSSGTLSPRQLRVCELYLPAGKYVGMKWLLDEATVKRGAKTFSLALPSQENGEALDIEFEVFARESLTLFVEWDPDESIFNQYLFKPRMSAWRQGMELKTILAYVTNTDSDALTVIDKQADEVVGSIAVGSKPRGVVVNGAGTKVYVANSGSRSISVVDTTAGRVTKTINNFGYSPSELVLSADETKLYAVNSNADNVTIIDTVSEVVAGRIVVGRHPVDIALDTDGDTLYVANEGDNTVSIIDRAAEEVEATVTVELRPSGLAVQDGKLYVANHDSNSVSVIGLGSSVVSKTVGVGQGPVKVQAGLPGWVYVTNANSNDCYFIYTRVDMPTQRVAVKDLPRGMGVDTIRRKLYVANELSDEVSIIDLASRKVKGALQVGRKPYGIAVVEE